ncbi:hypothetical protein J7E78_02945 [Paenibacillus polymyxa]|uniref:hypothetical protein n=1 Tax=Paenibacillus polymyxa TaxID=1406 RepID=UPI001BEB6C94|nr:hypothetical protein [Paenibacillus polymyxa]MBT2282509.1 hypothetical protein [Paenibacillus polymyxa]
MVAKTYLFSYSPEKSGWTDRCIQSHLDMLYDIKYVHSNLVLIKTDDDIDLLEKYLVECFTKKDRYFLIEITDQSIRFQRTESKYINRWLDDV